jgi:hypothetical protein
VSSYVTVFVTVSYCIHKKLVIEEGVTYIGSFSAQFPNLTGEVVIPSTVTYIGQEAFHKTPITKLTFAAGGTEGLCIANGAFKKLSITEPALPGDREYIHVHHWAFGGCSKLKTATFPTTSLRYGAVSMLTTSTTSMNRPTRPGVITALCSPVAPI